MLAALCVARQSDRARNGQQECLVGSQRQRIVVVGRRSGGGRSCRSEVAHGRGWSAGGQESCGSWISSQASRSGGSHGHADQEARSGRSRQCDQEASCQVTVARFLLLSRSYLNLSSFPPFFCCSPLPHFRVSIRIHLHTTSMAPGLKFEVRIGLIENLDEVAKTKNAITNAACACEAIASHIYACVHVRSRSAEPCELEVDSLPCFRMLRSLRDFL